MCCVEVVRMVLCRYKAPKIMVQGVLAVFGNKLFFTMPLPSLQGTFLASGEDMVTA